MNDLQFEAVTEASVDNLLAMARAFHSEDGHLLSPDGEAAVEQVARGDPIVRAWVILEAKRNDWLRGHHSRLQYRARGT